jgi:hypothetical protein
MCLIFCTRLHCQQSGLPDPRDDHAVVMARFARECLQKMQVLVKRLEVNLGPDTGDLGLRIGMLV